MNNTILPLLSTMAIGVIAGTTGTHFHQVNQIVQNGITPERVITTPQSNEPLDASLDNQSLAQITPTPKSASSPTLKLPVDTVGRTPREDALLKILGDQTEMLSAMRNEQKQLRKQLSETNRDMDELTFRVDAQSSDFRPLRAGSNSRAKGLTVYPDDAPDAGVIEGGVLPPKR